MVRRYYDLPSLTSLAVFEASARHLSFKLAASELNVTPGAVSRQVKAVEEEIGVPLFHRVHTGVMLTSAGEELYSVLANGFTRASEVVKSVKRGDQASQLTIACTDNFASLWLMPRMPDFWQRYPDISVDHLVSDDPRDFRNAEVQLRVRYGNGSWQAERAEHLFDDGMYPVCGPGFAQQHCDVTPKSLPELPLLHFSWVDSYWTGWDELFTKAAIPHDTPRGRRFGKFSATMQAAQADQGVAIGWHRLIHPLVTAGKLVRLTDLRLPAPGNFYLTWNENRKLSGAAQLFRDWMMELAAKEPAI
ncbi:DNA-binding transcriptional LysR family regulator [Mesorhizobium robiniae]|uniref:DNA-binding transcriptional LysR family regulator n=1 Tax=Mesorhizobium robiniae TaxID=559315 RepID=A0ABV2GYR9_9HYPH|nr:LysR substrate-binding domain-containing protein [Mesorhizobium sp. ZC-5]MCV3243958.1 LysR substrate-binding domain-containing protein [Mesorhizobium sp. ZC-5]